MKGIEIAQLVLLGLAVLSVIGFRLTHKREEYLGSGALCLLWAALGLQVAITYSQPGWRPVALDCASFVILCAGGRHYKASRLKRIEMRQRGIGV